MTEDALRLQAERQALLLEVASLRESKDRLQLALNTAEIGWWQKDPLLGLKTDARLQAIFGFTADESPSSEEFLRWVHPDDASRVSARLEVLFDPAAAKPYVDEYRIYRRDGEIRWVQVRGLSYFEGSGPERRIVRFGTVRDITERKAREEQVYLLMREVNHRAKNMLSVVHSIAQQTASRDPEDFMERFSERIQALSANQDLLVRNEWGGVEITELIRAQLSHFADLIGFSIALHGPMLRLNPAAAQAIGLALHELATNAGKYGALSTHGGRVDIGWEIAGDTLTMIWTEHDGPASPPERRGFGTLVMGEMAERSLNGKVDLEYAPSGVTWRLTCPAANAFAY
jgi:PAS domain S-box-containing protein